MKENKEREKRELGKKRGLRLRGDTGSAVLVVLGQSPQCKGYKQGEAGTAKKCLMFFSSFLTCNSFLYFYPAAHYSS